MNYYSNALNEMIYSFTSQLVLVGETSKITDYIQKLAQAGF